MEQLFAALKKAELIKSIRGPQGGYMLADDPENISVGDILRALEGSMAPTDCVAENGHHDLCDSSDRSSEGCGSEIFR